MCKRRCKHFFHKHFFLYSEELSLDIIGYFLSFVFLIVCNKKDYKCPVKIICTLPLEVARYANQLAAASKYYRK